MNLPFRFLLLSCAIILGSLASRASEPDNEAVTADSISITSAPADSITAEIPSLEALPDSSVSHLADSLALMHELSSAEIALGCSEAGERLTLYDFPYSRSRSMPQWNRL